MTVLVLGSTGSTGRRVTRQLRERGVPTRAASRHGEVPFDWSRPDTWGPALTDVSAIYVMAPDGVPVEEAFVQQAVSAGVERLVLLSTMNGEEIGDDRLLAAEQLVRDSGTAWSIVRAHWFNQNFDEGFFLPAVLAGELVIPLADQRQAFVDAEDIAAVAVEALVGDNHAGQTYEVTGPEALTFGDAATIISVATGRPIHYKGSPDDYRTANPDAPEEAVTAFTRQLVLGDATPTNTVDRLTGRPPVDFRTYAAAAAAGGGVANPAHLTPSSPALPDAEGEPADAAGANHPMPKASPLTYPIRNQPALPLHSCIGPRATAALAQSAERLTRNEKVVGSIPTGGSTRTPRSEASFLARGFRRFRPPVPSVPPGAPDLPGGIPEVLVDQVAVEVHRHGRRGVPQDPLNDLGVSSQSEPDRGGRVFTRAQGIASGGGLPTPG
ncbi:hypothetical protein GCM10009789_05950 [Kribbella sancticallisti]|uniref:NAD(P)-binding domain-containing protein n=1 Tax=Kribbella sancticallisti TaxID=460087 RepID=A0ABN2CBG6_9ACTN